jgi:YggT family protein
MTMDPNLEPRRVVRRESVQSEEAVGEPAVAPVYAEREQVDATGGGIESHQRLERDAGGVAHGERFVRDAEAEQEWWAFRVTQVVWLLVAIIEIFIGLRVLLKLLAANPNNAFASFVYNVAGVFLAPFFGLTGSPAADGVVLEIPSLIAMAVYALIGWAIVRILWLLLIRPMTRSATRYDRYTN